MFLELRNTKIHYKLSGKGKKIVLLHGYLEDLSVWNDFTYELEKHFEVLRVDLLGQGQSGLVSDISTVDLQAEMLNFVMETLGFEKAVVFGHSMGGYSTLAFLEKYPEKLSAFCLFHSHPFADSEMVKANRLREVELINDGKKELLIKQSIPNMFAEKSKLLYSQEIEATTQKALSVANEGIVAALLGMRLRPDRSNLLSKTSIPMLYIWGKEDKFVSKETFERINFPQNAEVLVLENSGHCGFWEEKEKTLAACIHFANKYGI